MVRRRQRRVEGWGGTKGAGGIEGGRGDRNRGERSGWGEKVEGEAGGREGGREEVSWISGAVLQRDTSAF